MSYKCPQGKKGFSHPNEFAYEEHPTAFFCPNSHNLVLSCMHHYERDDCRQFSSNSEIRKACLDLAECTSSKVPKKSS